MSVAGLVDARVATIHALDGRAFDVADDIVAPARRDGGDQGVGVGAG